MASQAQAERLQSELVTPSRKQPFERQPQAPPAGRLFWLPSPESLSKMVPLMVRWIPWPMEQVKRSVSPLKVSDFGSVIQLQACLQHFVYVEQLEQALVNSYPDE